MSKTFAVLAFVVFILVGMVVILTSLQAPSSVYIINFKSGETVSCDHVDYSPGFVICSVTDQWTARVVEYNSYPADSVLGVEVNYDR